MVWPFVWRDVSGTVSGGGSNGRWTVVSSDIMPVYGNDAVPRYLSFTQSLDDLIHIMLINILTIMPLR